MLYLLIALQLADIITTAIGLSKGATEANPVARWLFKIVPAIPAMVATKLLFSAPMAALAWFYPSWWPVPAIYCASLVYVVVHNLKVIRSMSK